MALNDQNMSGFRLPSYGSASPIGEYTDSPDYLKAITPSMNMAPASMGNEYSSLGAYGDTLKSATPNSWQQMTAVSDFGQGSGPHTVTPSAGGSMSDWLFGSTNPTTNIKTNGAASSILGAANGIMSGYMGLKGLGLAKDTLNFNKMQFDKNYSAQKGITNSDLATRQDLRNYENTANGRPGTALSTSDYMSQYGVK